jgi:hypothetical protein
MKNGSKPSTMNTSLFDCRKCHEHGHLFRDFPLNAPIKPVVEEKQKDGFTQVLNHKKQTQKKPNQSSGRRNFNNNSFDALNNLPEAEEVENPHKPVDLRNNKGKEKQNQNPVLEQVINLDPKSSQTQLRTQKMKKILQCKWMSKN